MRIITFVLLIMPYVIFGQQQPAGNDPKSNVEKATPTNEEQTSTIDRAPRIGVMDTLSLEYLPPGVLQSLPGGAVDTIRDIDLKRRITLFIDPVDHGAKRIVAGDEGNSNAAFAAAISEAVATGKTIKPSPGKYEVNNITIASGVKMDLAGIEIYNPITGGAPGANNTFNLRGALGASTTTTEVNAGLKTYQLNVANAGNFAVGDKIVIEDGTTVNDNFEYNQIASISGNQISFIAFLSNSYSSGTKVTKWRPIENVQVSGGIFTAPNDGSAQGGNAIYIENAYNCVFSNIEGRFNRLSTLAIVNSADIRGENIIKKANRLYAIKTYQCQGLSFDQIISKQNGQGGIIVSKTNGSSFTNLNLSANGILPDGGGDNIQISASHRNTFTGANESNSNCYGVWLLATSTHNSFSNFNIFNGGTIAFYVQGHNNSFVNCNLEGNSQGFSLQGNYNLVVGCRIEKSTGHGIVINDNSVGNVVTGNFISGHVSPFSDLYMGDIDSSIVTNNVFLGSGLRRFGTSSTTTHVYNNSPYSNPPSNEGGEYEALDHEPFINNGVTTHRINPLSIGATTVPLGGNFGVTGLSTFHRDGSNTGLSSMTSIGIVNNDPTVGNYSKVAFYTKNNAGANVQASAMGTIFPSRGESSTEVTSRFFIATKDNSSSTFNKPFVFSEDGNFGVGYNFREAIPQKLSVRGNGVIDGTLDIDGGFKFTDGSEGYGKVLTSDANGKATWTTIHATKLGEDPNEKREGKSTFATRVITNTDAYNIEDIALVADGATNSYTVTINPTLLDTGKTYSFITINNKNENGNQINLTTASGKVYKNGSPVSLPLKFGGTYGRGEGGTLQFITEGTNIYILSQN